MHHDVFIFVAECVCVCKCVPVPGTIIMYMAPIRRPPFYPFAWSNKFKANKKQRKKVIALSLTLNRLSKTHISRAIISFTFIIRKFSIFLPGYNGKPVTILLEKKICIISMKFKRKQIKFDENKRNQEEICS